MDYEDYIEMDSVTLEDCLELFLKKNITTIINDGKIKNFKRGE